MRRIVIPTLMLMIGCATGAVVREVVMPARAQGNAASYDYRVFDNPALIRLGKQADPNVADNDTAIERSIQQLGKAGWRLVTVTTTGYGTKYYFEARLGQ